MWPDLRYAARTLLKRPAASLAVVAILASAIAVATVLGALFAAVLHDVPPIESPDRVGHVWIADDTRPAGHREPSFADFLAWKEAALTLTDLTAFTTEDRLLGDSEGLRVRALSVTPEYFRLTGRSPMMGRAFAAGDGDAGSPIIISERLWRTRFNGDPNVIGRSLRIDAQPREVVGVMPPDFWFPTRGIEVWMPLPAGPQALIDMAGRLQDGRTWADARAEFNVLAQSRATPGAAAPLRALIRSLQGEANIRLGQLTGVLLLPALAVLLIACANVGNLLVMRLVGREKELAIRTALGASAMHLARLSLAETALVAAAAGVAGFVLALWGTRLLSLTAAAIPQLAGAIKAGPLTIVATVAATAITLVGTAVLPALRAARSDVSAALAGARRQRISNRFHYHAADLLVVLQIALAAVLVLVCAFQLRIVREVLNVSVPPAGDRTLVAQLTTRQDLPATTRADALQRVVDEASGVSGVEAIALATHLPDFRGRLSAISVASGSGISECRVKLAHVTPRFFDTIGVTFQSGVLRPGVTAIASVGALKSCAAGDLAAQWSVRSMDESTAKADWIPITGVVSAPSSSKMDTADSQSYVWILGARAWPADVFFLAASPPGLELRPQLQDAVRRASSELVLDPLMTMREREVAAAGARALFVGVTSAVALLALVLASAGVYSAVSQSCEHRRVELGIRLALGAPPRQLVATALAREAPLVAAGMVTGIVGTVWVTASVYREILPITALDPGVWMGVFTVLLVAAGLATLGPALRAIHVDPIDVLRAD